MTTNAGADDGSKVAEGNARNLFVNGASMELVAASIAVTFYAGTETYGR